MFCLTWSSGIGVKSTISTWKILIEISFMMMSRPLPSLWIVNSGHMPEPSFIISASSWMQNLG